MAGGPLTARAALVPRTPLSKPVLGCSAETPFVPAFPIAESGGSARSNFTFALPPLETRADLEAFRRLAPFERLAVLIDPRSLAQNPDVPAAAAAAARELGLRLDLVLLAETAAATLAAIPPEADAVYLTPALALDEAEVQALIDGLTARRLPSFSMAGIEDVRRGVLAARRGEYRDRLVRRLALNLQRMLGGAAPETLPVRVEPSVRLVLNARTASAVGLNLPYRVLHHADILHLADTELGSPITLASAYALALANHPGLAAGAAEVEAARADRGLARAALLPRLQATLQYAEADRDQAASSLGLQPRRATQGGISLGQLIFSDPAVAAFRAQSRLYHSRRWEQAARELDLLEQVAQAYLQLLSQRALLDIEARNQDHIQHCLDLARDRERSDMAGPEEGLRWESQLAAARASVMNAYAQLAIARTRFNLALGGRMEDRWDPADSAALAAANPFFDPAFSDAVQSDRHFEMLRAFLVRQALREAPELRAIEFALEAQTLLLDQQRRSPAVPELSVSFGYNHVFRRTLADPSLPLPGFALPEPKDDAWEAAAQASWTLFEGGARFAERRKSRAEIRRLEALRQQTRQTLAQQVDDALLSAAASVSAVELDREAADLARRNLEAVRRKYARGRLPIVDLLDAQTDLFVREQRAVLAEYQYMADVVRAQRAAASFPEVKDGADRARWTAEFQQAVHSGAEGIP